MARLKYPGGRKKSLTTEDTKSAVPNQTNRKKKKDEALPRQNYKVITREEYRQIFGDSNDEVRVRRCCHSKLQFFYN